MVRPKLRYLQSQGVPGAVILAIFHAQEEEDYAKPAQDRPFGAIIVLVRPPGFLPFREVAMPDPTWQALYRAALAEPDPIRLNSRIEAARRAIHQRLEQIEDSRDTRQRQQLDDALYALLTLAARKRSA
jgi:hypothetical protein